MMSYKDNTYSKNINMASNKNTGIHNNISARIFVIIFLFVFILFLLSGIFIGAKVYQKIYQNGIDTQAIRFSSNIIDNLVKNNDISKSIKEGIGPEGKSLVLIQSNENGDFEIRIYLYEGYIVQEYSLADSDYTPYRAQQIIEADSFDFDYDNQLLEIIINNESTYIALRSDSAVIE